MKNSHVIGLMSTIAIIALGLSIGIPIAVDKYGSYNLSELSGPSWDKLINKVSESSLYDDNQKTFLIDQLKRKNNLSKYLIEQKFSISLIGQQYYNNGCWIQTLRNILQAFGKDIGDSEKDFYEEHYCNKKDSTNRGSVVSKGTEPIIDYLNTRGIKANIINIKYIDKNDPQIDDGIIELLSRYFENNGNKPMGICLNWHWISIQDIKENVVIIYDSLNDDKQSNIIIEKKILGSYLRKKMHGNQLDVIAPFLHETKFDQVISYNALNGGFESGEIENAVSNHLVFRDENNIPVQLACLRDLDGNFFIGHGPNKKHKLKSTKQDELINEISTWYSSLEKNEQKQWFVLLPQF